VDVDESDEGIDKIDKIYEAGKALLDAIEYVSSIGKSGVEDHVMLNLRNSHIPSFLCVSI
jgi:hypothetical protein